MRGKRVRTRSAVEVPEVQPHRPAARARLARDGARDLVARAQLVHELLPVRVDEPRPLAAQGLGQQETGRALDGQGRGVELDELHVEQRGPRAQRHGHAVARGHGRVGGLAEHLARAAGGQQRGPGQDPHLVRGPGVRPSARKRQPATRPSWTTRSVEQA